MALASWGGPLLCRHSTQRHFEPFCFFFQADPAQLAYQPCPIMWYLRAKSCRIFLSGCLMRALDELERSRLYKGPRNRTLM
jgi:hypothetical protein